MPFILSADTSSVVGAIPTLLANVSGGGYISIYKSVILIGILLLWCWMLAWADVDAKAAHLPRTELNFGNLAGMLVAYAVVFLVPLSFWILLPIVLIILAAEVGIYLKLREKAVGLKDLKDQYEAWKKGIKKAKKSDLPGPVTIVGKAGPLPAPEGVSPDRPLYDAVQGALTDPLRKLADQIDLAPSADGVAVKYTVDLVQHSDLSPLDATMGPSAIAYLKAAAGMDVNERRKPQTGTLKFTIDGNKRDAKVQAAGSTAGEFLRIQIDPKTRHSRKMGELGFSPAQFVAVTEQIKQHPGGVVLLCTPKGQGLTQLMYGIIRGHDAFLQHIQTIEHDPVDDVEGATVNKMPATATAADVTAKIDWAISQQPDVLLVDKVESAEAASLLMGLAGDGRRVYVGMRASSCAEAIEQWRKVAGNDSAIDSVRMVICGRVIRKLCSACKEPYAPDANTLKKLNMDAAKVTQLFKARETPVRDEKGKLIPCTFCLEMKFKGRVGVFEVLTMNDELKVAAKQDLAAGGKLSSNFRAAFRKAKTRFMQEEALALVERGETSVQEVLRVLRPAEDAAPAARPAAAAQRPAAAAARPAAAGAAPAQRPAGQPRPPGQAPRPPASRPPSGG